MKPLKVHFPVEVPHLLLRQSPRSSGYWGNIQVCTDKTVSGADIFVSNGNLPANTLTDVPKERRIFFVSEPPGILEYSRNFIDQFGLVVSPYKLPQYSGETILRNSALLWWAGIDLSKLPSRVTYDFDELSSLNFPEKTKTLSVVVSTKNILGKHASRLRFIEKAKTRLGDRLDVFGRGFMPIADKADALFPYSYHLAIENNDIPHFWTEKIADAYLGFTYPFYSGCKKLSSYFPEESFLRIDVENPDASLDLIERHLDLGTAASRRVDIIKARNRLLHEHNIFCVIEQISEQYNFRSASQRLSRFQKIEPAIHVPFFKWLRRSIKNAVGINRKLLKPKR
jgi:hypothetical protein